jgi:hypothetical protein
MGNGKTNGMALKKIRGSLYGQLRNFETGSLSMVQQDQMGVQVLKLR